MVVVYGISSMIFRLGFQTEGEWMIPHLNIQYRAAHFWFNVIKHKYVCISCVCMHARKWNENVLIHLNIIVRLCLLPSNSSGLSHAAAAQPSLQPHQEDRWFLPTGIAMFITVHPFQCGTNTVAATLYHIYYPVHSPHLFFFFHGVLQYLSMHVSYSEYILAQYSNVF